ncbi:podocalyxin [Larimichthys crocea]|uniref:podocalyxin n=1 Tax=Larimichthys crocea TaxID=215358 RepID=UPI0009018CE9|nr:podocalyxin [Larimichthys crocea]
MRVTLRLTWLLLSLSFIFHSVCSDDVDNVNTASNNTATAITSVPVTVSTNNTAIVHVVSGTVPTVGATTKNEITQIPVTTKSATAVTTQGNTAPSTAAVTPNVIQTTATITHKPVTGIPTAPTTQTSGSATTVVKTTTPLLAATTDNNNNNNSVVRPTNTLQNLTASVPSNTSGTEATVRTSADNASVGKTTIPSSTDAPTVQQSTAHTITTTLDTNQVSQRGTEKTTVTAASHGQLTTVPAGNKGTTGTPSTLTKEVPPAAQTSGTTASIMPMQTTSNSKSTSNTTTTTTTTTAQQKLFMYSLNNGHESEEEKELVQVCKRLMMNLQDGNCSLSWRHQNGKIHFDSVEINGKVKTNVASQYYDEITKKPTDNKTLIAILASCGALLIMIVILALCASHHRKPYNENQQHLTEELHTVENGYHDNPTLEVMEVQPEMQEKKMTLNGEFNDSWIVPMDNVLKEDMLDEEDTHL